MNDPRKLRFAIVLVALLAAVVGLGVWLTRVDEARPTDASGSSEERTAADDSTPRDEASPDGPATDEHPEGGASLSVRVVDGAGTPIGGATVGAFPPSSRDERQKPENWAGEQIPLTTASTDADGRVDFDGLTPGSWSFVATKSGWARVGRALWIRTSIAPEELVIRLSPAFRLTGRVLDPLGRPIAGARVVAHATGAGTPRVTKAPLMVRAVADDAGRFSLEGLEAGETDLLIALGETRPVPIETVDIPRVETIDLVLPLGGSVTGRVLDDATGEPISGADVYATATIRRRGGSSKATSDRDGRFRIETLIASTLGRLEARREGWLLAQEESLSIDVPFGTTIERDVRLRRGVLVHGTVTGPDGPIEGAYPMPQPSGPTIVSTWSAKTDAQGRYAFHAAPGAKIIVGIHVSGLHVPGLPTPSQVARHAPECDPWWIVVPESGEVTHDIVLVRGHAVSGRVVDTGGAAIPAALVVAFNVSQVGTDAEGAFTFEGVEPPPDSRHEEIWAEKSGWLTKTRGRMTFGDAGPTGDEVVVVMTRAPTVSGTVRSSAGKPLVAGSVTALAGRGRNTAATRVPIGPSGEYSVELTTFEGRSSFRISAADHAPVMANLDLVEGKTEYDLDVVLEPSTPLTGRVIEAGTGRPLAGVPIAATPTAPRESWRGRSRRDLGDMIVAVTDADGRFSVDGLAPGTAHLIVGLDGFVEVVIAVEVPTTDPITIELTRGGVIAGNARLPDGTPAAEALLYLDPESAKSPRGDAGYAITTPDGAFAFRNLLPGRYEISARPFDGRQQRLNVLPSTAGPFEVGDESVEITVVPAAAISGVIRDGDRHPIQNTDVRATLAGPRDRSQRREEIGARGGRDGTFALSGLKPGTRYDLSIRASGYQTLELKDVAAGTTGLDVVLEPPLVIAGVIVDARGAPLKNARVYTTKLSRRADGGLGIGGIGTPTATDGNGRFELNRLVPTEYRLRVGIDGLHRPLSGGERITPPATGLRLVASDGRTLEGVVVDGSDRPIVGATVEAHGFGIVDRTTTDAQGRFRVTGLPTDLSSFLAAKAPGWKTMRNQWLKAEETHARLVLEPGLLTTGRVLDPDGAPIPNASLRFLNATGARGGQTDGAGRFSTSDLPPGRWEVTVRWNRKRVAAGHVDAGARDVELRVTK